MAWNPLQSILCIFRFGLQCPQLDLQITKNHRKYVNICGLNFCLITGPHSNHTLLALYNMQIPPYSAVHQFHRVQNSCKLCPYWVILVYIIVSRVRVPDVRLHLDDLYYICTLSITVSLLPTKACLHVITLSKSNYINLADFVLFGLIQSIKKCFNFTSVINRTERLYQSLSTMHLKVFLRKNSWNLAWTD